MRRLIGLAAVGLLTFAVACSDDAPGEFDTNNSDDTGATGTGSGAPTDLPAETGDAGATEGDGDGDPTTGGDGDPTTGDGDGDPTTGDGDGDTAPVCGNGVVDLGEQCDGTDLGGISCIELGYSGGTLGCDPVTCTYDASACTAGGDGNSSGTTG